MILPMYPYWPWPLVIHWHQPYYWTVPTVIGDAVDDSIDRLHTQIMAFGLALHDLVYVPGTWRVKPGATSTDAYRFLNSTWDPFMRDWMNFRSEKTEIPWQTLPGSGSAHAVQQYRTRFGQILLAAERAWLLSGTGYHTPEWALHEQ
jgi:hypothetical protein